MLKSPYRHAWMIGLLIVVGITLVSIPYPFLWDTVYHSSVANEFFQNGFGNLLPSAHIDNGNPTLYPILLTLVWKIGGHSLAVSHLFFAIVLISLLAGIIRLSSKFLHTSSLWIVPLLLWCDPTFMAQSLLMGYDVLIVCLAIWGIICILENRKYGLALTLTALVLIHYRGAVAVAFLFITQLLLGGRFTWRKAIPFVVAVIAFTGWQLYHYIQSGWFLLPEGNTYFGSTVDFIQWTKNATYSLWRASDLGRIGVWILAIVLALRFRKRLDETDWALVILALSPIALNIALFAHSMLPVSQRYFMLSFVVVIIIFIRLTQDSGHLIKALWGAAALTLICGNLWFYPQRFGNAWDASLIFTPWPGVEKSLDNELKKQNIKRSAVAAEYPLTYRPADAYLNEDSIAFTDMSSQPLQELNYVFYSNFSNMYNPDTMQIIQEQWIELWRVERGRIFAALYENPSLRRE